VRQQGLWIAQGREHVRLKQWGNAAADFVQAIALLPVDSDPWSERNRICGELAQHEEAFAKAIDLRREDAGLWLARGRYYARKGRWKNAAAAYTKAIALPSAAGHGQHLFVEKACLHILAGDSAAYGALCAKIRRSFAPTENPETVYLAARMCVLAPTSGTDPLLAAKLVNQAMAGKLPSKTQAAAYLHVLGMADCRAGHFQDAVHHLDQSRSADPDWIGTYLNWPMLAVAHHRLGHREEARKWLDKTARWSDRVAGELAKKTVVFPEKVHPADWLEFEVLRREAEAVLQDAAKPKVRKSREGGTAE